MISQCPIVSATTANCIEYQKTSADFARDAAFYLSEGALLAAVNAQNSARAYHDAASDRLERLIGTA